MSKCCASCFSDTAIIDEINSIGSLDRCAFCGAENARSIEPERLMNKLEIFTYGVSEDVEGARLSQILDEQYGIFGRNVRDKDMLTVAIFGEAFALAKRYKLDFDVGSYLAQWEPFKHELKHVNRFFPKNEIYSSIFDISLPGAANTVFFQLLEQLRFKVFPTDMFFRARISDVALSEAQMGCPPHTKVTGGRANPHGIPYLYLAENLPTCISEVRPSNASEVYVSEFKPTKELVLLNLTSPRTSASAASFEEEQLSVVLSLVALLEKLSSELSKPIDPDKSTIEYIPTQFLCEFIKSVGKFDGIVFNSSFGFGRNYVLYNSSDFLISAPRKFVVNSTQHDFSELV